ncbi:ferritin-like fold-containing protein [Allosalinactinospora lopnorensis]|uniref:ferritin-like fold-containing protein n=1 Tax=Allosalinactinospora lopnorensis TaxID=1352348 RepID=UPI0009E462D1|nr:ferritin-like fold-containing protein [Allosalinactinospora lopnorensis]
MTYGSADSAPDSPAPAAGHPSAVLDLLGLLAYAELVAFFRLTDNAELAPTLAAKGELAGLAATEYAHYKRVHGRLAELGADPEEAMGPFVEPLDAWHARTRPQSWLESLVKAYVGDGIAGDFYRKVAERADDDTRALAQTVLSESDRGEFIAAHVRAAVAEDPALAGRLSLWARRLVGEALSQAQVVATARVELASLLTAEEGETESEPGDLAAVSRMFAKLTDTHNARLEAMGLSG